MEALIKVANKEGQQIFLELDPNHSSVQHPWFKRSVEKEEPFTSYYVWANGIMDGGKRKPPNNWVSSNRAMILNLDVLRKIIKCAYFLFYS